MQTEGKARHFRSIKSNTGVTSVVCRELIIRKVVALIRSRATRERSKRWTDPFFFFRLRLKEIANNASKDRDNIFFFFLKIDTIHLLVTKLPIVFDYYFFFQPAQGQANLRRREETTGKKISEHHFVLLKV